MKTTEEIAYDQSIRAIDQQIGIVDELRSRSAVVLTGASIAAGFLGRSALADGVGPAGVLAILFFAITALLCISILFPRFQAWQFAISAKNLIEHHVDVDDRNSPEKLHRYLAEVIDDQYEANELLLKPMFLCFWLACVCLAVDIVLWLLELAVS